MRGVSAHEIYTTGNKHADPDKIYKASADVVNLVSDTYIALFSHFIPCGVWEAVYILDSLLSNASDIQPDTIHADTQGASLPVFGLAAILGFDLLPRIRNWHDLNFYRPDPGARYQHIDSLFEDNVIDWDLPWTSPTRRTSWPPRATQRTPATWPRSARTSPAPSAASATGSSTSPRRPAHLPPGWTSNPGCCSPRGGPEGDHHLQTFPASQSRGGRGIRAEYRHVLLACADTCWLRSLTSVQMLKFWTCRDPARVDPGGKDRSGRMPSWAVAGTQTSPRSAP